MLKKTLKLRFLNFIYFLIRTCLDVRWHKKVLAWEYWRLCVRVCLSYHLMWYTNLCKFWSKRIGTEYVVWYEYLNYLIFLKLLEQWFKMCIGFQFNCTWLLLKEQTMNFELNRFQKVISSWIVHHHGKNS